MNETDAGSYKAVTEYCEESLGSAREHPFGETTVVYKVGGKMFACISEEPEPVRLSVKLPPEEGLALRAEYPEHVLPGYHLNKRHWNTIVLDGTVDQEEVLGLVRQSYDAVVSGLPKRLREVASRRPT